MNSFNDFLVSEGVLDFLKRKKRPDVASEAPAHEVVKHLQQHVHGIETHGAENGNHNGVVNSETRKHLVKHLKSQGYKKVLNSSDHETYEHPDGGHHVQIQKSSDQNAAGQHRIVVR